MSYKDAKENYRNAKERYENNPTPENEQAMIEAKSIIVLVIAVLIMAAVLPSALQALNGANTTGFSPAELALWGVIGVIIIAVVVMKLAE